LKCFIEGENIKITLSGRNKQRGKSLSYGVFGDPAGVLEKLYSGYLMVHSA
jgi:hypothetical protein